MVDPKPGAEGTVERPCLCCGTPRASRSIPACWEHWKVLPEDLRSFIVTSYGRGQTKAYGDALMDAVKVWRRSGHWRMKIGKARTPVAHQAPETQATETQATETQATETLAAPHSESRIISLIARRQKITGSIAWTLPFRPTVEPEGRVALCGP